MTDSEKAKLLDWLVGKMIGTINVAPDGSREPQVSWTFVSELVFRSYVGPTPLEGLQNAYAAEQAKTATKE